MAFSDLCKISNAFKNVENEPDQSDRIMEENAMVRDLITKILDETGPNEHSPSKLSDKSLNFGLPPISYKPEVPPPYSYNLNYMTQEPNYNTQNFNNFNFDNDILLEPINDSIDSVTPEQLNLLRLAAQEIGGAQFNNPKYEEKPFYYNQRNPEYYRQEYNQEPYRQFKDNDVMSYLNSLNITENQNVNYPQMYPNYENQFKMNEQREMPNYLIEQNMRENLQKAALLRQNQELARINMLVRNCPPPNQLNVDVFLHDNVPFNMGMNPLLGPSPPVPQPIIPSPIMELPLIPPFYAMRNMRTAHTSSAILHARLDACYEQWRQLERERKRTEAKLALAFPGKAVSSSNSIPVPRLPPCPTRVDRLTVDMLREHTKVLTLMGKMETLRASVCISQNKKPSKDESKITVLKRGQENLDKQDISPENFEPGTWRDDVKNLAEIAPHSEVEQAMLSWRSAVGAVQAARRRELAPNAERFNRTDPILQLADAVKQLAVSARRARCAMWCDLTLTVAMAPNNQPNPVEKPTANLSPTKEVEKDQNGAKNNENVSKQQNKDIKEDTSNQSKDAKTEKPKTQEKQQDKNQPRRNNQNYKRNNQRPNDFYKQRYDNRFVHRHPYYLATGPIN